MAVLAIRILSTTLLICVLTTVSALPSAASSDKYALMAIYIYNFSKFTDWPLESFDSRVSTLNLCILGDDPFGVAMDEISGKKVRSRTIDIILFPRVAIVSSCHILFISRSEQHRLDLILKEIGRLPILTISDIKGFSELGGMVTLQTKGQLVHFEVNPHAAALTGIKVSSKLLELASVVVRRQ